MVSQPAVLRAKANPPHKMCLKVIFLLKPIVLTCGCNRKETVGSPSLL